MFLLTVMYVEWHQYYKRCVINSEGLGRIIPPCLKRSRITIIVSYCITTEVLLVTKFLGHFMQIAELVFCCRAEAGLESLWSISIPLQSTGKYGETRILKPWITFCFIDSRQSFSKEAEDIPNLDFSELLSRGLLSKIFIFPSLMFLPDLLHVAIFSYTAIYLLSRRPSNAVILRSISWLTMLSTWFFSSEVIVSAFISKRQ